MNYNDFLQLALPTLTLAVLVAKPLAQLVTYIYQRRQLITNELLSIKASINRTILTVPPNAWIKRSFKRHGQRIIAFGLGLCLLVIMIAILGGILVVTYMVHFAMTGDHFKASLAAIFAFIYWLVGSWMFATTKHEWLRIRDDKYSAIVLCTSFLGPMGHACLKVLQQTI